MTPLTRDERALLLEVARESIQHHLGLRANPPQLIDPPAALEAPCGAFVTLEKRGELRGCIGTMVSRDPLWRTVARMAVQAASADPRFPPLLGDELAHCTLEISVLSPMQPIEPEAIAVGTHGLMITNGYRRGVLLPQVPEKYGWDARVFLEQTCIKAQLPRHAWREAQTTIEAFTAEVFSEE
ncbi:MAG: AmmeMemoRadiSam system protein A [Myxococcales bacterium]|nr:AmmeMemoRadiSam system protein A [Myxococcales bacterium]